MPLRNRDGIYDVLNEEQYRSLIQYSKEQNMLVVLKVFAPWCKACLKLAPKFVYFSKKEEYRDFPILWAQLTCKDNKDLIEHVLVDLPHSSSLAGSQRKPKSAGIPSVQLYDGGKEIFTLPCPPSNLPTLKEKLKHYFENEYNAASRDMPDDGDADVVVLGETQWTRTRLFPNSPVIVRTSAPLSNGRLDDVVGDAVLAVSTIPTANGRDVNGGDWPPSGGWTLEIHQPDDLSQPMTVSLELDLAEEYENFLKAFAMQGQQV